MLWRRGVGGVGALVGRGRVGSGVWRGLSGGRGSVGAGGVMGGGRRGSVEGVGGGVSGNGRHEAGAGAAGSAVVGRRARRVVRDWMQLSKFRLTGLVAASAGFGHLMVGLPSDLGTLGALVAGTALASASANTWNQLFEKSHDAKMLRTRFRPLPSLRVSAAHATAFGAATGIAGVATLLHFCGPTVALLGASNIALYSLVYTPLKRVTPRNTEVGAVVGAIPPLMGWASAGAPLLHPSALSLFLLLFLWQMPHFYALAWRHRKDYANAGYEMISRRDPTGSITAKNNLAYTAALSALPLFAALTGVTGHMFAVEGTAVNLYMLHLARKFKQNPTDANARALFLATLWYLPLLMAFMVFHSKAWIKDDQEEAQPASQAAKTLRRAVTDTRAWLKGNACPHEVAVEDSLGPHPSPAQRQAAKAKCAVQVAKSEIEDIKTATKPATEQQNNTL